MITDPRIFDEAYLPRRLEHRDPAVRHLSRHLEPAAEGDRADDVLIAGPSGVGKTVLSRYVLQRLDQPGVRHGHVRCLGQSTAGVLRRTVQNLPIRADVHRGTSLQQLEAVLRDRISEPTVVVLDEADDLVETDALDSLRTIPDLSVVVVVHDETEWLARADEATRSRFVGDHVLTLDRYRVSELADILAHRAEQGLPPNAISREQLERIADDVAGVARRGIQTLREAAAAASEDDRTRIADDDIDAGRERARQRIRESNLDSLPFHHHVLYELVRSNGPLTGQELHAAYDDTADALYRGRPHTPVGRRSRRNKLSKLRAYDLLEQTELSGDVRYAVHDEDLVSPVVALSAEGGFRSGDDLIDGERAR